MKRAVLLALSLMAPGVAVAGEPELWACAIKGDTFSLERGDGPTRIKIGDKWYADAENRFVSMGIEVVFANVPGRGRLRYDVTPLFQGGEYECKAINARARTVRDCFAGKLEGAACSK